jgi:hypothetical protein
MKPGGLGLGHPATVPNLLEVPRSSAVGVVRRCARGCWLRVPCGFLPGQTCLHSPGGLSPPHAPQAALTLVHCSSSGWLPSASIPHPCPQWPQQRLGWSVHAELVLGLMAPMPEDTPEWGPPLFQGHTIKSGSRDQKRIIWKDHSNDKDFPLISITRTLQGGGGWQILLSISSKYESEERSNFSEKGVGRNPRCLWGLYTSLASPAVSPGSPACISREHSRVGMLGSPHGLGTHPADWSLPERCGDIKMIPVSSRPPHIATQPSPLASLGVLQKTLPQTCLSSLKPGHIWCCCCRTHFQ